MTRRAPQASAAAGDRAGSQAAARTPGRSRCRRGPRGSDARRRRPPTRVGRAIERSGCAGRSPERRQHEQRRRSSSRRAESRRPDGPGAERSRLRPARSSSGTGEAERYASASTTWCRLDEVRSREVRDRPRDLERAIEPATRERVEVDRRGEELARVRRVSAPRVARRDRGAGRCSGTRVARSADAAARSGRLDPFADRGRRLARLLAEQLSLGETRDHQPDVDAVEQRARRAWP